MKNTLLFAGFTSLVLAVVLYTIGYTNFIYEIGNGQLLIYPAAFFALLSLVLIYRAVKYALITPEK